MQEIKKLLPKYDYLFYGDTIHMPYGDKNSEQIREYTFAGLQWLFDHGCKIVIIACNTAAAYSIRDRQNKYPDLKTLSVTIPGIQALDSHRVRSALFLSTIATAHSGILPDLVEKYHYTGDIRIQSCA
jgi:glutamate racemase